VHELHGDDLAVALAEDAEARPVLALARPDHQEVATDIGRDGGTREDLSLAVRRVGVDPELAAERGAVVPVALGKGTVERAILIVAVPDDDEVA
jgi:hypothetical protein